MFKSYLNSIFYENDKMHAITSTRVAPSSYSSKGGTMTTRI